MDSDSHHGHGHGQDNDFTQSPWAVVGGSYPSQQSPSLPDYHGFSYGPPPPVMPMVSPFAMTIPPPPYASLPLTSHSHTWPSMLVNQGPFSEPALPLTSAPPSKSVAAPAAPPSRTPPSRKASTGGSTPRRTLTDEDRRNMCLYHEDNKGAKQTDIGVLFGVERSTVSKVLRQKEKYLNPDDGSRSPAKRAKGRVPDIEKALSNWARNYQRQGFSLTDEAIREKALFFASTCGFTEGKSRVLSTSWLERFKQKYRLTSPKSRKNSSTTRSESESPTCLSVNQESAIQSPSSVSPTASPTAFGSPSPTQSQDNIKEELMDSLTEIAGGFQHLHNKSTTSIDTSPSFSTGLTSPASTMVSDSPFTPVSQSSRLPSMDSNPSALWSQTFTHIEPAMMNDECFDKIASRKVAQQRPSVSVLESPNEEARSPNATGTDTIKRNHSNPDIRARSIYPPTSSKSTTVSPVSSPDSPTKDEARRALELVMNYFEHQQAGIGAQEYMTMGKLMERLKLAQSQQGITLPGGLTRIDELDDPSHVRKKRSIHDLNWS